MAGRVSEIGVRVRTEVGLDVSDQTVSRFLRGERISSIKIKNRPLLKSAHRQARVAWMRDHVGWDESAWKKVIWSDEAKFTFDTNDGVERAFKRKGEKLQPHHYRGTRKFGGGSVMIWGCMTACGTGQLVRVEGNMDSNQYKRILSRNLPLSCRKWGTSMEDLTFQQDGASCHTSRATMGYLERKNWRVLDWVAQSPDMNPIEWVWKDMKKARRKLPVPRNADQLWEQLLAVWNSITVDRCEALVATMPRRLQSLRKARGGTTNW